MSNSERTKAIVHEQTEELLQRICATAKDRVNGKPSYVCPICGHGKNGDGMCINPRSEDGHGLHCFGCGFSGDVIDLYLKINGTGYRDALADLADKLGIDTDADPAPIMPAAPRSTGSKAGYVEQDNTPYYHDCIARLDDQRAIAYLAGRGISRITALSYGVGFDPAADPAGKGHPTPRIIIPCSTAHYVGRSIDPDTEKKYQKMNNAGAKPGIFNRAALSRCDGMLFVVEGVFDALSLLEIGADAIALNSAGNYRLLVDELKEERTKATLVLCLDQDATGQRNQQELEKELRRLNVEYVTADICCGCKDANEALQKDRAAFQNAVERVSADRPDNVLSYMQHGFPEDIEKFKSDVKTGFANLDKETGGLYPGLYCIGAISSLGKTTFCLQMADNIAAAGNDVIFFSLEQSRCELVSKSISRTMAKRDIDKAATSLQIRRGYNGDAFKAAMKQYAAEVGDRLSIIESNFVCTASRIGDYVRDYMKRTGTAPVVFVDYLQILQPDVSDRQTSAIREIVDASLTALKQLSRELNITIFTISSINRNNYLMPIDFESFKESGGIEYTCDVIFGLQFSCLEDKLFNTEKQVKEKREKIKEAKSEDPRKIELCCLKNRFGQPTFQCSYLYHAKYDLFKETENEYTFKVAFD